MEHLFNFLVFLVTILVTAVIWDAGIRNQRKDQKRLKKLRELKESS